MKLPHGLKIKKQKLIGQGIHGQVYSLNKTTCIKIYKKQKYLSQELANLLKVEGKPWFTKVFKWGNKYMIREYVNGIQLDKYLKKHP